MSTSTLGLIANSVTHHSAMTAVSFDMSTTKYKESLYITPTDMVVNRTENCTSSGMFNMDCTTNIFENVTKEYSKEIAFWQTPQLIFLSLILAAIIIGNSCVLFAIGLSETGRKTRMNYFIMHLAISDLSVGLFFVSGDLAEKASIEWHGGNVMCKAVKFMQITVMYASTYVLVALSIDRFDAIAKPMNFSRSAFRARMLIYSAWTISALFSIPALFLFEESFNTEFKLQMCIIQIPTDMWRIYFTLIAVTVFIVPAIIITVCYSVIIIIIWNKSRVNRNDHKRESSMPATIESRGIGVRHGKSGTVIQQAKIRTIKMTFVIVLVFVMCWCPYVVFNLLQVYVYNSHKDQEQMSQIIAWIQSMAPMNSAVNPIIYGVFSTRICRNLRRIPIIDFLAKVICRCQIKKNRNASSRLSHTTSWNDHTYFTDGSIHSRNRRPGNSVRRTFSDSESTILGPCKSGTGNLLFGRDQCQPVGYRKQFVSNGVKEQYDTKSRVYRRPSGMPLVNRCLTAEDSRLLKAMKNSNTPLRLGESQI